MNPIAGFTEISTDEVKDASGTVIRAAGLILDGEYFSNGVYWLEETHAPDGFNPLAGRIKSTVSTTEDGVFAAVL